MLLGVCDAVGKHETPFRIGVQDLNGFSAERNDDVIRLHSIGRNHVVGRRYDGEHVLFRPEFADNFHCAQYRGGPSHIAFHADDAGFRLN